MVRAGRGDVRRQDRLRLNADGVLPPGPQVELRLLGGGIGQIDGAHFLKIDRQARGFGEFTDEGGVDGARFKSESGPFRRSIDFAARRELFSVTVVDEMIAPTAE